MRRDLLIGAALAAMFDPLPPKPADPEPRRPGLEPWQKDVMDATIREALPGMHPRPGHMLSDQESAHAIERMRRLPDANGIMSQAPVVWPTGDPEALSRAEAKRARKNEKRLRERQ